MFAQQLHKRQAIGHMTLANMRSNGVHTLCATLIFLFMLTPKAFSADSWPEAAISYYLYACVKVHKERWSGVDAFITRQCNCKLNYLRAYPWERFAKDYSWVPMEEFALLSEEHQMSVFKDAEPSEKLVLSLDARAEEKCFPR